MPLNRLAHEASPYLQQHATNPVDWYPWGPEALERAHREDKPILLSIGYSACHWCHVMERESFEDDAIATLMNRLFVSVKVDREERPDLDQVYQLVVQLMGQGGGWPLTVFLTPDQKPFFGGTYFPPADKYGRPGFPRVLEAIAEAYHQRREEIVAQSEEIAEAIGRATDLGSRGAYAPGPDLLARASERLAASFDDVHGGFGRAPKFPNTMALEVLLRRAAVEGDDAAKKRVRLALDAMRAGGIWDHLGGGFHRYSTDARWLVPHFEKMLYDNALLLGLYADAYRAFGEPRDAETVRSIAAYVEREMTDAAGGFYATQDADSEGEEGSFFVWSLAEVKALLAGDALAADVAIAHFGIRAEGNFEERPGKTVLSADRPMADVAAALSIDEATARDALARARAAMRTAREARTKPFRDEKILASWNGLMIGALARAGTALGEESMLEQARRAFAFLERTLLVAEGDALRVLRHAKDGVAKGPGFLDDVSFVASAALDLYEATGEPAYVGVAERILRGGKAHFSSADGGFFFTPDDGEKLLVRAKDPYDHAIPSGVSMMALAMLRLESLTGEDASVARATLESLAGAAVQHPAGMSQIVSALHRMVAGTVDVVVVGSRSEPRARALMSEAQRAPLLSRTLAWIDPSDAASIDACRALAEGKPLAKAPAAYVCRGSTCSLPVSEPTALARLVR
jgi:uncharacterized protein YyaL (SSP411 family)